MVYALRQTVEKKRNHVTLRLLNFEFWEPPTKIGGVPRDESLARSGETANQDVGNGTFGDALAPSGVDVSIPRLMTGLGICNRPSLGVRDTGLVEKPFLLGKVSVEGGRQLDHRDRREREPVGKEFLEKPGRGLPEFRVVFENVENDARINDPHLFLSFA